MESTQSGDTSLTVDSAAQAIRGLLGANQPPKTEEPKESKQSETKAESTETPKAEEDVQKQEGQDEKAEDKDDGKAEPQEAKTDAEIQLESLEELAEASGLSLEKILSLKAKTKVDGIEDTIPLAQLVKSYQLEGHLNRKTQELADKLKSTESEREKFSTELSSKLQEANQLIGHFEQQFMAEFNSVNWQELRQTDPAEFAAKKQDYNDRYSQLMSYRQQVQANAHRLQTEAQEKAQAKFQEIVRAEEEKLLSKFSDWKDPEKAKTGKKELSDYLVNYGFNDNEIAQIYDHRQVDIIHKAMLYDKMSQKSDVAMKKVVLLPKVLKPTSSQATDAKSDAIKAQMKKLEQTGRIEDAAALFKLRLKGKK